jgi:hypothetical protein
MKIDLDNLTPEQKKEIIRLAMSELGKRGGASTSKAKQRAVRENGKKGGRPKKKVYAKEKWADEDVLPLHKETKI